MPLNSHKMRMKFFGNLIKLHCIIMCWIFSWNRRAHRRFALEIDKQVCALGNQLDRVWGLTQKGQRPLLRPCPCPSPALSLLFAPLPGPGSALFIQLDSLKLPHCAPKYSLIRHMLSPGPVYRTCSMIFQLNVRRSRRDVERERWRCNEYKVNCLKG